MTRMFGAVIAAAGMGLVSLAWPSSGAAQYLDPRAGQAVAICNSAAGAAIPECAALRAATGAAAVGAPNQAAIAAAQRAYALCVQAAGINQAALQQCNANLNRTIGLPPPNPAAFAAGPNGAVGIANAGARYQQCVSALMAQGAQPGGINPCTPLLQGQPAGPGAPQGFGAPGVYNPPAPAMPAPVAPRAPIDPLAPPNKPFDPLGL